MASIPHGQSLKMRISALENEASLEHVVVRPLKIKYGEDSIRGRRYRKHSRSLSSLQGDIFSDFELEEIDLDEESYSDYEDEKEGSPSVRLLYPPGAFTEPSTYPELKVQISDESLFSTDSDIVLMEGEVTPQPDAQTVMLRRRSSFYRLQSDLVNDGIEGTFKIIKDGIQVGDYEIKIDGFSSAFESPSSEPSIYPLLENGEECERMQISDFEVFGARIGKGNSGTVVKALNMKDFHIYAIKHIGVHLKENRHQMIKELNMYNSVQCPHLVTFYGAFFDQGNTSFILEYMNRGSLQDVIDYHGAVRDEMILKRIAKQILLGLFHMHSNQQVHRDIKPANILLNRRGEAKITDFGISRTLAPLQEAQSFVGTRIYMSPERIQNQKYGYPSDIWSFGLTIQTLACGKFPFTQENSSSFLQLFQTITKEDVPRLSRSRFSIEFRSFLSHCLRKNPSQRWSAEQLLMHPFVSGIDETIPMIWPWDTDGSKDHDELKSIIQLLSKRVFTKQMYKRDRNTQRMIANIAESLAIPVSEVRTMIENNLPIKCLAKSPFC